MKFCLLLFLLFSVNVQAKEYVLLHVSFDVTRELFKEINETFIAEYKLKIKLNQSHGGSGKQTSAIIHGLPANIVSLALPYHMDMLADKDLVAKNWRELFPNNSSPMSTSIVFLVRSGNPKAIKDWDDLIRNDVKIITANPKTSGGALWNYASAWLYAQKHYKDPQEYMRKLYHNAPVLDSSARGAAITFLKRNIGDVLITWESEAQYIVHKLKPDYEIIKPSMSIKIDIPIAMILHQKYPELAKEYINFLFSRQGQAIIAKYYYQPMSSNKAIDEINWKKLKTEHFDEDGIFERIYK